MSNRTFIVFFATVFAASCFNQQPCAQEQLSKKTVAGLDFIDMKTKLLHRRLDLIETRTDDLNARFKSLSKSVSATSPNRSDVKRLSLSLIVPKTISEEIDKAMQFDQIQRTDKLKIAPLNNLDSLMLNAPVLQYEIQRQ